MLTGFPSLTRAEKIIFSSYDPSEIPSTAGALGVTGTDPTNRDLGSRFIVDSTHTLESIYLPVGWERTGANAGDVWLMSDAGGVPGDSIETFSVSGFGDIFYSSAILTSSLKPTLLAHTPYWVVVSAEGATNLSWLINNTGHEGVAYRFFEGAWGYDPDTLAPALQVTGTETPAPVPEPSSILLISTGAGALALRLRRRDGSSGAS
jgi:hypothetical protein